MENNLNFFFKMIILIEKFANLFFSSIFHVKILGHFFNRLALKQETIKRCRHWLVYKTCFAL